MNVPLGGNKHFCVTEYNMKYWTY